MLKRTIWALLALHLAVAGNAQMQASPAVGIDEKLGATVALDVPLKDEAGNTVTLRQYVDKPTILLFNYFRCPGICPVLISSVVDVVNRMQIEPGTGYRILAVSFDPADTPEIARDKKANYLNQMRRPFSPDYWHFLTGPAEETTRVAASAGFNYSRQGDMYVHPGALILLTPRGIISSYLYGTSFVPAEVEMGIQEAAGGQVIPTISKVLSFCYVTDPQGRGRVFSVTRFAGAVILVAAVIFLGFILRARKVKN